jgi:XTP/dITP diphosphohydrolase
VSPLPGKIVMASSNPGKLRELSRLLDGLGVVIVPQSDYGVEDAEENGTTFRENSYIKARHAAAATGLPAIADDSGLVVDALEGRPGVYSARYAGPGATDRDNVARLLAEMASVPDDARGAAFH